MRTILYIILLSLISGQIFPQEINPEMLRIQSYYGQGQYDKVLSGDFSTSDSDQMHLVNIIKGNTHYQLGEYDQAIVYFEEAERIIPGSASLEIARSYLLIGNKTDMFRYLSAYLERPDKLPRKDIMLDPVFSNLDNDREWIRLWSKKWYDDLDDKLSEAAYQLEKNNIDEDFWAELIENHSDNPQVLAKISDYYRIRGDKKSAKKAIDKAVELAPEDISVGMHYYNFFTEYEEFGSAIQVLDRMIKLHPYEIGLHLRRVQAIFQSGQTDWGLNEMKKLEEYGVDASGIYLLLAQELLKENPDIALSYLDEVILTNPSDKSYNLRAKAYKDIGDKSKSISDLSMSLDINPKQAAVYFNRAQLRLDTGDTDGACYDWEHALNLGHRKAADMLYKYCR